MHILPVYAALLALLFLALSVRTILLRRASGIAIGASDNRRLQRAARVHANFAEYVPITLFLIYLVEVRGAPDMLVHGLCICLLVGRLSHAWGVSQIKENLRFRVSGMSLTFTALTVTAGFLLLGFGAP